MLIAPRPAALTVAASLLALSACGSGEGPAATADGGRLAVLTSFYPLQFVTERVGGDLVDVRNLTPPGAEPHDLELTPQDVAGVSEADLVVHLGGFQPAVDEAVEGQAPASGLDVAGAARQDLAAAPEGDEAAGDEQTWRTWWPSVSPSSNRLRRSSSPTRPTSSAPTSRPSTPTWPPGSPTAGPPS